MNTSHDNELIRRLLANEHVDGDNAELEKLKSDPEISKQLRAWENVFRSAATHLSAMKRWQEMPADEKQSIIDRARQTFRETESEPVATEGESFDINEIQLTVRDMRSACQWTNEQLALAADVPVDTIAQLEGISDFRHLNDTYSSVVAVLRTRLGELGHEELLEAALKQSGSHRQSQTATDVARGIAEGDSEAVGVLMDRFGPWLERAVSKKIGAKLSRRIDPEDIMQSTFWSFVKRASDDNYQFEHTGALCRLLLTIAENKCRSAIRSELAQIRDARPEISLDEAVAALPDDAWQATVSDLADSIDKVADAVDTFGDRDAEMFRRAYFLGQSALQISTELGWALATVKRRLAWAIQEVRGQLGEGFL